MSAANPSTRKLVLFGVAVAVPLAAVALYFALFDQPPPPPVQMPAAAEQGTLPPDHPPIGGQAGGAQPGGEQAPPPGHPQMGGAGRIVRIPEDVKGKWRAVKLRVEEKDGKKPPQFFTVTLGGQLDIPGSSLHVRVGDFLPALQVSGNEVTSASNSPTNPAVMVAVSEGGKETFRGWLFAKFPEMQSFEHPKYRIALVEGIPAS